jgi:hypothetical protein
MADTRIFRIIEYGYNETHTRYGNRRVLAGITATRNGWRKRVVKVEATNDGATEGWTDVTEEFFPGGNERKP